MPVDVDAVAPENAARDFSAVPDILAESDAGIARVLEFAGLDDEPDHNSRCAALVLKVVRRRQAFETRAHRLATKTQRYVFCGRANDNLSEVIDLRCLLEGLLAWPQIQPTEEDSSFKDFKDLLKEPAGQTK